MKTMKKVFAMLVTVCMMIAMSVSVFATDTYTLTINNTASGHNYEAYQVFSGTLSSDGKTLSNIEWGSGVNDSELLSALKESTDTALMKDNKNIFEGCTDAASVAGALASNSSGDDDVAQAFAKIVAGKLDTTKLDSTENKDGTVTTNYTISGLTAGYYFVKDGKAVTGDDTATRYILKVVKDESVIPKGNKPTSQKKVQDVNDSDLTGEGNPTSWQDSADYDIGDSVPFQLTATLPSNYADYKVYKMTFHDVESDGLTFKNDAKVYVVSGDEKKAVGSGYVVNYNASAKQEDGCTFDVVIADTNLLKDVDGAAISLSKDSKIVVEYTSELNSSAKIGYEGNPNESWISFSNNPNSEQGGDTGTTPKDKVIVFTYKVIVNKTDSDGNALKGAGFTLYKYDADKSGTDKWISVGDEVKGTDKTTFTWNGLDDGFYKLEESTVPDGYNKMENVYFKVAATHDEDSADPQLKTLSATQVDAEGNTLNGTATQTFTADKDTNSKLTGALTANVVNKKGSELPSTGGIGTTIFYVVGSIMVVGAAVLLITKKRMSNDVE